MKLEIDKSVWNKMKQRLSKGNMELRVGWFESDKYDSENDNLPVAQIAKWNEEGHINGEGSAFPGSVTPPRPFLRKSFMEPVQKGIYDSYFIESIQKIAEGKSTFAQEYKKLGPMVRGDLQEVIMDFDRPENSPKTVEIKGNDNVLVDSGTMHDSVSWMVAKQGEE